MKFYVGVTNDDWFNFLKERQPEEVNFWRPGGLVNFKAIKPGAPFLFKLHSPNNFVAGGGFFVRHAQLPLSLAWDCFGEKNGAASFSTVRSMVNKCRQTPERDPIVGCTILTEPFFFERDQWIPVPRDWSSNIVSGKTYPTSGGEGQRLWFAVQERLSLRKPELIMPWTEGRVASPANEEHRWREILTKARIGQGTFRVEVTEVYQRRCALTGEKTLPVLEACHIRPYADNGPNRVNNGLLLRSDLHTLFDRGYMTVTPDLRVQVSRKLREEFHNGRIYYDLHGHELKVLPDRFDERPSGEYLAWHNENVYLE